MKFIAFDKENNNWYVKIDNYEGPKSDLLMVAGTDKILDDLAEGNDKILFKVSDQPMKDSYMVKKFLDLGPGGAWYRTMNPLKKRNVWFCKVLKYVMGVYPKEIYFQKMI